MISVLQTSVAHEAELCFLAHFENELGVLKTTYDITLHVEEDVLLDCRVIK